MEEVKWVGIKIPLKVGEHWLDSWKSRKISLKSEGGNKKSSKKHR